VGKKKIKGKGFIRAQKKNLTCLESIEAEKVLPGNALKRRKERGFDGRGGGTDAKSIRIGPRSEDPVWGATVGAQGEVADDAR